MAKTKTFLIPLNSAGDFFKTEFPKLLNEFMCENEIIDDQIISVFCPHSHLVVVVYKE